MRNRAMGEIFWTLRTSEYHDKSHGHRAMYTIVHYHKFALEISLIDNIATRMPMSRESFDFRVRRPLMTRSNRLAHPFY